MSFSLLLLSMAILLPCTLIPLHVRTTVACDTPLPTRPSVACPSHTSTPLFHCSLYHAHLLTMHLRPCCSPCSYTVFAEHPSASLPVCTVRCHSRTPHKRLRITANLTHPSFVPPVPEAQPMHNSDTIVDSQLLDCTFHRAGDGRLP